MQKNNAHGESDSSNGDDPFRSAETLLPTVYDELRRIAAAKMAGERRDQTLQATALVHEAWIRLTNDPGREWPNRAYFFAAASEAMRRILIEKARRKLSAQKAGLQNREDLRESQIIVKAPSDELLAVHEALADLESEDPQVAELVKLRYFVHPPHRRTPLVLRKSLPQNPHRRPGKTLLNLDALTQQQHHRNTE